MRGSQQIEVFGGLLVNEGYSARRNGAHGAIKIHGMIGEPHTQLVQGQDFTVLRQGGQRTARSDASSGVSLLMIERNPYARPLHLPQDI